MIFSIFVLNQKPNKFKNYFYNFVISIALLFFLNKIHLFTAITHLNKAKRLIKKIMNLRLK